MLIESCAVYARHRQGDDRSSPLLHARLLHDYRLAGQRNAEQRFRSVASAYEL